MRKKTISMDSASIQIPRNKLVFDVDPRILSKKQTAETANYRRRVINTAIQQLTQDYNLSVCSVPLIQAALKEIAASYQKLQVPYLLQVRPMYLVLLIAEQLGWNLEVGCLPERLYLRYEGMNIGQDSLFDDTRLKSLFGNVPLVLKGKDLAALFNFEKGKTSFSLNRPDLAMEHISSAITIAPHFVTAHASLGLIHTTFDRHLLAQAAFAQALKLCPENHSILKNIAATDYALGDIHKAIQLNQRLIDQHTSEYEPYWNLSMIYRTQGKPTKAIDVLTKAIERFPSNPDFHIKRGEVYFLEFTPPKTSKAIVDLTKAIELNPFAEDALISRAHMYYMSGQFDLAKKDFMTLYCLDNAMIESFPPDIRSALLFGGISSRH